MIKHDIIPIFHALCYLLMNVRLKNIISPVKILKIQMSRISLARSFWFQNKPLALCIHDIKHCPSIIKSIWKRIFKCIINIFHIKSPQLLIIFHYRTFHRIRPCSHIIHIRLRDWQAIYCFPRRKVQFFLRQYFPRVRNSFCLSRQYQCNSHHCLISIIRLDKIFWIL